MLMVHDPGPAKDPASSLLFLGCINPAMAVTSERYPGQRCAPHTFEGWPFSAGLAWPVKGKELGV